MERGREGRGRGNRGSFDQRNRGSFDQRNRESFDQRNRKSINIELYLQNQIANKEKNNFNSDSILQSLSQWAQLYKFSGHPGYKSCEIIAKSRDLKSVVVRITSLDVLKSFVNAIVGLKYLKKMEIILDLNLTDLDSDKIPSLDYYHDCTLTILHVDDTHIEKLIKIIRKFEPQLGFHRLFLKNSTVTYKKALELIKKIHVNDKVTVGSNVDISDEEEKKLNEFHKVEWII